MKTIQSYMISKRRCLLGNKEKIFFITKA